MRLTKRVLRSNAIRTAVCYLGSLYIRFVFATTRWTTENSGLAQDLWAEGKPFILAFWHGRLLMMPYCWNHRRTIHMLISAHRDGQIIAKTVHHFGIETIEGSTTRGGLSALRSMLKTLRSGGYIGITPDGPRGPRMRVSGGIIDIARMSGAPILPCTFSARGAVALGSWDRFILARPFSRGVFVWGDPIRVDRNGDDAAIETARLALEAELNRITEAADLHCGFGDRRPRPSDQDPSEPARSGADDPPVRIAIGEHGGP